MFRFANPNLDPSLMKTLKEKKILINRLHDNYGTESYLDFCTSITAIVYG